MTYRSPEPIDAAAFRTTGFDCGEKALNRWLARHAVANNVTGRSKTFVIREDNGLDVVAYYCLSTAVVQYADATSSTSAPMPPGEPIPAVLLGRLAVDRKHQGKGLGKALLRDAVLRTLGIATEVGVRVMLVNAKNDDVVRFYTRWGFEPSPTDSLHLMLLMSDARLIVGP